MKNCVCVLLLCLTIWLPVGAQRIEVTGSKVSLSGGNVLGAVFYEGKGIFFVHQSVPSTEVAVGGFRFHRELSSWDVKSHSMISTRSFDRAPEGASPFPCGRVEISAKLNRIFLCSAVTHLDVVDPNTLASVGTVAEIGDQNISDFAVDDVHARVQIGRAHV